MADMGKRVRLKAGDVFVFDLDDDHVGVGQIVETGMVFLLTILEPAFPKNVDLSKIDPGDILLTGWTTDAQFFHDRWQVVGNMPVPITGIPRPCSKVRIGDEFWIQDYRAAPVRKATKAEQERLDYRISSSPIAYQDAFRAHHGLGDWRRDYEKLTKSYREAQAAACKV
jgi:hypothetical protein